MESLGHENRLINLEDGFSPVTGVVGAAATVVRLNRLGWYALADGVSHHIARFVIVFKLVIAADQQLLHFARFVQIDGGVDTVAHHRAQAAITIDARAKNNRNAGGGNSVGRIDLVGIARLNPGAPQKGRSGHKQKNQDDSKQAIEPARPVARRLVGKVNICRG